MKDSEFDRDLEKAITAEERREQKEYLRSIESSLVSSKKQPKKFNWRIAATILVLIGLGGYFFLWNQSPSSEELYSEYFSPHRNIVLPIVREQVDASKKSKAFASYEQGAYQKAIEEFNQLTVLDSIHPITVSFYKANAYLQLDNTEKARDLFLHIQQSRNTKWKEESLWYLALTYLKMGNPQKAKQYLLELKDKSQKGFKKQETLDLLDILE